LLTKSHARNDGPGSNRSSAGPTVFQPSHRIVQIAIAKKKPIEPTRSVTHTARRSDGERLRASSTFTFREGANLALISTSFGTFAASLAKPCTDMAILPD